MKYLMFFVVFFCYGCSQKENINGRISAHESEMIKNRILQKLQTGEISLIGFDSCYLSQRISSINFTGQYYNSIYEGVLLKYINEPFINYNITVVKTQDDSLYIFGFDLFKQAINYKKSFDSEKEFGGEQFTKTGKAHEIELFNELIRKLQSKGRWQATKVHTMFDLVFKIATENSYWSIHSLYDKTFHDHIEFNDWLQENSIRRDSLLFSINFFSSIDAFECVKVIDGFCAFKSSYSVDSGFSHVLLACSKNKILLMELDNPPIEVDCSGTVSNWRR